MEQDYRIPPGLDKLYDDDHRTAGAITNLSRCCSYEPTPGQSKSLVRPQVARSTLPHYYTPISSEPHAGKIYQRTSVSGLGVDTMRLSNIRPWASRRLIHSCSPSQISQHHESRYMRGFNFCVYCPLLTYCTCAHVVLQPGPQGSSPRLSMTRIRPQIATSLMV